MPPAEFCPPVTTRIISLPSLCVITCSGTYSSSWNGESIVRIIMPLRPDMMDMRPTVTVVVAVRSRSSINAAKMSGTASPSTSVIPFTVYKSICVGLYVMASVSICHRNSPFFPFTATICYREKKKSIIIEKSHIPIRGNRRYLLRHVRTQRNRWFHLHSNPHDNTMRTRWTWSIVATRCCRCFRRSLVGRHYNRPSHGIRDAPPRTWECPDRIAHCRRRHSRK